MRRRLRRVGPGYIMWPSLDSGVRQFSQCSVTTMQQEDLLALAVPDERLGRRCNRDAHCHRSTTARTPDSDDAHGHRHLRRREAWFRGASIGAQHSRDRERDVDRRIGRDAVR